MTKQFTASCEDLSKFNGAVLVVRPLTKKEADISDVGPMYKCRAPSGEEFDAFGDELA